MSADVCCVRCGSPHHPHSRCCWGKHHLGDEVQLDPRLAAACREEKWEYDWRRHDGAGMIGGGMTTL